MKQTLKDYLNGLGVNISSQSIVQMAKALKPLMDKLRPCCSFTPRISPSHCQKLKERSKVIVTQLNNSNVFSYIPGQTHASFKHIKSHISGCVNVTKLVAWVKDQQNKLANSIELQNIIYYCTVSTATNTISFLLAILIAIIMSYIECM